MASGRWRQVAVGGGLVWAAMAGGPLRGHELTGAAVFADAGLTTPGLVGSYIDRRVKSTPDEDWRATQPVCGVRTDADLAFTTATWGARATVGVTGGTDTDWERFSVQWDGFLQVTQAGQRFATASNEGSRLWLDLNGNGAFEPEERFETSRRPGPGLVGGERSPGVAAGAYRIRVQYWETIGPNELRLVSANRVPPPFVPAPGNPRQTVRVLVLNFEPRIPSEGNRRLWEVFGWNDPRRLARQFAADTQFMTGGAVQVQIVEWRHLEEFPRFVDGFRYAPDEYVRNRRANSGWHNGGTDFYRLAEEQKLADLVNASRIDEVWCFGDHYFSLFGETWMAGPNAFFVNGPCFPDAGFDRAIVGYGFNYERGMDCVVHNLGHRTENHGQRAFGAWNLATPTTAFDRFSANQLESPGAMPGVGTCHVPANADAHYDYTDPRVVESTALDWVHYPKLTGTPTPVSRDTWAFGPTPDYGWDYQVFYFASMPRNAGTAPDGRRANWFTYIWDFNSYEAGTGLPREQDAFGAGAMLRTTGGTEHTLTVRYYDTTGIDPATLADGNVEVRGPGGFVQAAALVTVGPEVATTAGTARTVTYRVPAPGGTWDPADSGRYRIAMRPDQVRDTAGHAVPGGEIGGFQVRIADPAALDLARMLAGGQATVVHTTLDIGPIANLFDGSVDTLIRTPNIDPAVVTLTFGEPQTLHGFATYFSHAGGDPSYRWQVETADSPADLDARQGSWRQAVAPTGTPGDTFSRVDLATPVTARLVRLTATRLTGDDYVHIQEWQLLGPPAAGAPRP